VRQYAFKQVNRKPGERSVFFETLCWKVLSTGKEGNATFEFDLCDSVTSFNIFADCITTNGIIGSTNKLIQSKEPFYMEPKMPLEVTSGDKIQIPISLVNSSTEEISVNLSHSITGRGLKFQEDDSTIKATLKEDERKRYIYDVNVGNGTKRIDVKFDGDAGPFHDSVTRSTTIVQNGFPAHQYYSGAIEGGTGVVFDASVPDKITKDSLRGRLRFYPNPTSSLNSALLSLSRYPHGCFEQITAKNYPLVMAYKYMISHKNQGISSGSISNSINNIQKGYEKLINFECKSKSKIEDF